MNSTAVWNRSLLAMVAVISVGCLDYLNPRPDQKKFEAERIASSAIEPKLTDKGELPYDLATGPKAVNADDVVRDAKVLYSQLCVSCHGANGDGNGPAAAAMNPKPRNFRDKSWQSSVDDAHVAKVIGQGGASVGLSPMMAPWGSMINAKELDALVGYVRDLGK